MAPAASATQSRSERSQATAVQAGPTRAQASLAADQDFARPRTCAPLAASELIVSKPIPELQPVTTNRLPVRSIPARTWSAVERPSNGFERIMCYSLVRDRRFQRRTKHACGGGHTPHEFLSRVR